MALRPRQRKAHFLRNDGRQRDRRNGNHADRDDVRDIQVDHVRKPLNPDFSGRIFGAMFARVRFL